MRGDQPAGVFEAGLNGGQQTASSKHMIAGVVEWGHGRDGSGLSAA
jgi:hypothetical protein